MPGQCFGEAILFSDADRYPISAVAKQKSTVFFVEKQSIMHGLTHHPILLDNFLRLLSNKLTMMNRKIKVLSLDTIRQKVCNYLLKEYQLQGTNMIQTAMSRKAMAEHMSIQRPSLSRELIKMKEEGLIDFDKSTIKILDVEALEDELIG
jgi:CRP-like cAMP-binding protein